MRTIGYILVIFAAFHAGSISPNAVALEQDAPHIAKWHGNRAGAVSLRFDDSLESHVIYVIPKLNVYGIKATFMVNPGLERYKKNSSFWETQVPRMGHQLGNHTMHHRGAKTVEEADFEIGEVSRLIWKAYPDKSKLLVFASGGGGVRWGGEYWSHASQEYKELVKKYFLIDLYDGHHPYKSADSRTPFEGLIQSVRKAVEHREYQAIVFHKVGRPDIVDRMKSIYRGFDLEFSPESFDRLVSFLHENREVVWTAPVGDILKYETERKAARVETLSTNPEGIRIALTVGTDEELYDQELTLIVPNMDPARRVSIRQGDAPVQGFLREGRSILVPVRPTSSVIDIRIQ